MTDSIVPSSEPVAHVLRRDGQTDFHLIDLGRRLSDQLRASRGEKPPYKEVLDSVWLQPLIGGSSTVAASLGAGNVFLATANPAALMPIGAGVGSAVLGSTGSIVAQAPFVAAGASLIPVLAPIMAFLTFSSLTANVALKRVRETLDELYRDKKAEDSGELKGADKSLREIVAQFAQSQVFTPAMTNDLHRSRTTIRKLHGKYEDLLPAWLFGAEEPGDRPLDRTNIAFFAAARLLNLRADFLRLYSTYQDDREHAEQVLEDLLRDCKECRTPFEQLKKRMRDVKRNRRKAGKLRKAVEHVWLGRKKQEEALQEILKLPLVRECSRRRELTKKSKSLLLFQTFGENGGLKACLASNPGLEEAARLEVAPRKSLDLARDRELDESGQPEMDMGPGRLEASEERAGSAIASFRSELKTRLAAIDRRLSATEDRLSKVDREVAGVSGKIDDLREKLVTRVEASEEQVRSEIASFQGEVRTQAAGGDPEQGPFVPGHRCGREPEVGGRR